MFTIEPLNELNIKFITSAPVRVYVEKAGPLSHDLSEILLSLKTYTDLNCLKGALSRPFGINTEP